MLTSRSGSQGHSAPPPPQSIEAVRRRARHRLMGAAVLVLLGVIGFPLLFDTQPRPIAVDVPIEIPSRNPAPVARPTDPAVVENARPAGSSVSTGDSLGAREEVVESRPAAAAQAKPGTVAKTEVAEAVPARPAPAKEAVMAPAQAPAAPVKPVAADDKAGKAVAAVPAKPADKIADKATEKPLPRVSDTPADKPAAGNERIVVQVGAFAEVDRAREARLKLERAGLKTYTHVAETAQGKRIRVRMGPFATRAEADKAAARAKALGLPAALLWL